MPQLAVPLSPSDAAAAAVLAAIAEPGQWAGPVGVVRVEARTEQSVEGWTVRFAADGVRFDPDAAPDATLRLGRADLDRLIAGDADGALLYLAGRLDVSGDQSLVLDLGRTLLIPGSTRTVIDPAALDPVAVSAAIADVDLLHLTAVMAGDFRQLVLSEVFRRLPSFLITEKAAGVRVSIGFEIGGRTDGLVDRYVVRVDDGTCAVLTDATADEPVDATLVLEGHQFLRLVLGHLNPVRGVLSGQIQVRGQVIKALGFNSVIRIPGT